MLTRAYRITDRLGLVIVKTSVMVTDRLLEGAHVIVGFGQRGGGGVLAVIIALLAALFGLIFTVLRFVANVLLRIGGVILAAFGGILSLTTRGATRITGQTARAASSSAGNAMARRAARAELDATLIEDPLRSQNRVLSGVVVIVLAALVVAVVIATRPTANTPTASSGPVSAELNVGAAASPTVEAGLLATPVPTATQLPEVLQAAGSVAFVAREMGQDDIWAVGLDTFQPVRITNSPEDDRDPAWSPDGRRLAYASRREGNWDIFIQDVLDVSADPLQMTFGLGFQAAPVWSPDGLFLAFESYQNNNLDIYFMAVDGSTVPEPLPDLSEEPEFSPAWSPGGRQIAYVSWQDGNQEIYVFNLDTGDTINLTNTPDRHEDFPAWSPDGELLAYSAVDQGIEKVFVKAVDEPNAPAQVFRQGSNPTWSPDGNSIIFGVETLEGTQFIVAPYATGGVATDVVSVALPACNPDWTDAPLPTVLLNSGGLNLGVDEDLFVEQVIPRNDDPPYGLGSLPNVEGALYPNLSDRVNDSFNALRERVNEETGVDFLGTLEHALWDLEYRPNPNEPNRNWHRTGRAFSFNRNLLLGFPAQVEVVREATDLQTYWRVYVRVDEDAQAGELGEPLRRMPWEFVTTADGDVEAYDAGGRLQPTVPDGYYIDLTQLVEDYGWQRVAAGSDWRANAFTRNYWMFYKPDGLTWYEAMREIYTVAQLGGFNPTPTPPPPPSDDDEDDGDS